MAKEENPNRSRCLTALSGAFVVIVLFAFFGSNNSQGSEFDEAKVRLNEARFRLNEASARYGEAIARYGEAIARFKETGSEEARARLNEARAKAEEAGAKAEEAWAGFEEELEAGTEEARAGLNAESGMLRGALANMSKAMKDLKAAPHDPCKSTGYFEKDFVGGWIYSDGDHHMTVRRAFPSDYNTVTRALELLAGSSDRASVKYMLTVLDSCP